MQRRSQVTGKNVFFWYSSSTVRIHKKVLKRPNFFIADSSHILKIPNHASFFEEVISQLFEVSLARE